MTLIHHYIAEYEVEAAQNNSLCPVIAFMYKKEIEKALDLYFF